jgi:hypothetical protein
MFENVKYIVENESKTGKALFGLIMNISIKEKCTTLEVT